MLNKFKKRKDNTKKPLGRGCLPFFGQIILMLLGLYLLFNVVDYIEGVTDDWEKKEEQQTKTADDPIVLNIPKEKVKEKTVDSIKDEKESDSCQATIKGNISRSGEKIYHVPGGDFYETTVAEEKFCSSVDAMAAGYRKSKR